jgi:hypothetical protein
VTAGNIYLLKYNQDKKQMYIDKTNIGVHGLLINSIFIVEWTNNHRMTISATRVRSTRRSALSI